MKPEIETAVATIQLPDFSKIKTVNQADINRRNEQEKQIKIASLRTNWNAPARHASAQVCHDGEWGQTFELFRKRLNTGALMALTGTRGSGKTQLAVELMRYTTNQLKTARFTSAIGFFMQIKATYRKDATQTEADVLQDFTKPSLLVIDEVGKRSDSEWENNLLFELLNRRYNAIKDTVLIDNRTKAEFIAAIGESLASRMMEGGGIKECNWKSFRA